MALGGLTNTGDPTVECEAFDSMSNHWFRTAPLPFSIVNSTCLVMNKSKIYLLPGKQSKKQAPFLRMCVLEVGTASSFQGDPTSKEYGYALAQKTWSYVEVSNPEFVKAYPVAAV